MIRATTFHYDKPSVTNGTVAAASEPTVLDRLRSRVTTLMAVPATALALAGGMMTLDTVVNPDRVQAAEVDVQPYWWGFEATAWLNRSETRHMAHAPEAAVGLLPVSAKVAAPLTAYAYALGYYADKYVDQGECMLLFVQGPWVGPKGPPGWAGYDC